MTRAHASVNLTSVVAFSPTPDVSWNRDGRFPPERKPADKQKPAEKRFLSLLEAALVS